MKSASDPLGLFSVPSGDCQEIGTEILDSEAVVMGHAGPLKNSYCILHNFASSFFPAEKGMKYKKSGLGASEKNVASCMSGETKGESLSSCAASWL